MTRVLLVLFTVAFFVLPLGPAPVFAYPLNIQQVAATCSWHGYVAPAESNAVAGQPYWDSNSWDSYSTADDPGFGYNPANLGALLEGRVPVLKSGATYDYGADAPGAGVEYWADADLDRPDAFWFENTGGAATYTVKLLGEIAANAPNAEFGWFPLVDPAARTRMFTGAQTRGAEWQGTIAGEFGLYYEDPVRGLLLLSLTESGQFAPFRLGDRFYVGVEDLIGPIAKTAGPGLSDYDYNDIVVSFEQEPVPEPATLFLLGPGVLAIGWSVRRRRSR
jgi:hypothetical protein